MEEEIWKDIPGFKGWYQASNFGNIRSVDRYVNYKTTGKAIRKGKILTPKKSSTGYLEVSLIKNGVYCFKRVHQLVAQTFIPNPNNYPYINHINEVKTDNRVINLEWCTPKQNTEAFYCSRITIYQYDTTGILIKKWNSITKAAESINGDKTGIQHCCKMYLSNGNMKKTYKGYIWTYTPLSSVELAERTTNRNLSEVIQMDMQGNIICKYNSMTEAAKTVGCNQSAISMACQGLRNTIKGYKWRKN